MTRTRLLSFIAVMALAAVACTGTDRPDTATWLTGWETIVEVVPERSALGDPPDEQLCQQTLASLRADTDALFPSPSEAIDDLAEQWAALAESAFFECPPESENISSFEDAYAELRRIEESIDSALTSN